MGQESFLTYMYHETYTICRKMYICIYVKCSSLHEQNTLQPCHQLAKIICIELKMLLKFGASEMMCRIESEEAMKCVPFTVNVYENSVGLSSTNPKPKGQPSISLPAQANLIQQKAEPLRCLALRTRGGSFLALNFYTYQL